MPTCFFIGHREAPDSLLPQLSAEIERHITEYGVSKNPGIVSIQKICDGLEISIREFFDDPLFENLDPEIK